MTNLEVLKSEYIWLNYFGASFSKPSSILNDQLLNIEIFFESLLGIENNEKSMILK